MKFVARPLFYSFGPQRRVRPGLPGPVREFLAGR